MSPPTAILAELLSELDDLWQCLDRLFATLTPQDWSRKHGQDWIVADLPYHLAYYDRELIANAIVRGPDLPVGERRSLGTMADLHAWNAAQFAKRPKAQTPQESLAQLRASRALLLSAVSVLSDADLGRPVWCQLPGIGWQTVASNLTMCIGHTWNHLLELRLRLKRDTPVPGPAATHRALSYYARAMPVTLDRAAAAQVPSFTMTMDFTGPGGGAWSFRVADGTCRVSEGGAAEADLVMSQSPETFVKMMTGLQPPMILMLTRKIRVRGFSKMGTFGKLFPAPKPETRFVTPAIDLPVIA